MTTPIERQLKMKLLEELKVNAVVYLNGPRQAGKSTLVQNISKNEFSAEYITFDSPTQRSAAAASPENFLRSRRGSLIIDEVQLVPELFRVIKLVVDELRQETPERLKGRFLLTGSANIMAMTKLAEPMVGRMGVLTLYPFSGSEVLGGEGNFINRLFREDFLTKSDNYSLNEIIRCATFPEISRESSVYQSKWFEDYLNTLLLRDVKNLAEIEKVSILPNLLRILAHRSGSLLNDAEIARDCRLNPVTTRNYKTLLKMLYLTFELKPWFRNVGKRMVKSTKGFMIDSMMISHLLDYDLDYLETNRPEIFGHVLENFVASELLKLISTGSQKLDLLHFRTSDNKEVDFVLEKPNGELAGIEVKKSDQVSISDFKGLGMLQHLAGEDFKCGVVLYNGRDVVPFGHKLWAVPISNLYN